MKVLILSHNALNSEHAIGKTLGSLFSIFKKEELCQIYISGKAPINEKCDSYLRLSDSRIFKQFLRLKKKSAKTGKNSDVEEKYKARKRNFENHFLELIRDYIWEHTKWFDDDVDGWIKEQKPTHLFVAVGSSRFIYDMALLISEKFGLPMITYICDDFYFYNCGPLLINKIWKRKLDKIAEKLFVKSDLLVTIADSLSALYQKKFNVKCETIYTASSFLYLQKSVISENVKSINYFGKLTLNRYKSIIDVLKSVDLLNKKENTKICLNIYTDLTNKRILKKVSKFSSVSLHEFVVGEEFISNFLKSDVLLFVESFDKKTIQRIQRSMSTKIADSLCSGIPLLAYGPSSVNSMNYLMTNDCAICATNKNELSKSLKLILDKDIRISLKEKQLLVAKKNHNLNTNGVKLYNLIKDNG